MPGRRSNERRQGAGERAMIQMCERPTAVVVLGGRQDVLLSLIFTPPASLLCEARSTDSQAGTAPPPSTFFLSPLSSPLLRTADVGESLGASTHTHTHTHTDTQTFGCSRATVSTQTHPRPHSIIASLVVSFFGRLACVCVHHSGSPRLVLSSVPSPSPCPSAHSALSMQHHALRHHLLRRRCAVSSVAFSVSATRKASASTRRSVPSQRARGPSQALLASDEPPYHTSNLSSASRSCLPWAAAEESPRLAPAAAAVLARRARESVLRQERCAADLLYFMGAERRARHRRVSARSAPFSPSPLKAPEDDSTRGGLLAVAQAPPRREKHPGAHALDSSISWADLDVRLATPSTASRRREARPPSREDTSASSWHASVAEHRDGEGNCCSRTASPLFRQQQALFNLRRRLAYLLASECAGAGDLARIEVEPLHSVGRRTALALSLTHSIFKVCAANACMSEAPNSADEAVTGVAHDDVRRPWTFVRHRLTQSGRADSASSATDESSSSLLRFLQPDRPGHCPFVYRSVAQPVELTPAEAYALLTWCADQLRTYANAVTAAANRKDDPEFRSAVVGLGATPACTAPCVDAADQGGLRNSVSAMVFSSGGALDGGEGERKIKGCQRTTSHMTASSGRPRWSASATRRPSTLSMVRRLPRGRTRRGADGSDRTSAPSLGLLESEPAAEAVGSSAKALIELTAVFARMAAESALPMADAFASHTPEETTRHAQPPKSAKLRGVGGFCDGDDAVSVGEALLGRVVSDVVLAVCDALHAVQDSGLLGAYVASHLGRLNNDPGRRTRSGPEERTLAHAAAQDQQRRDRRTLHRRLCFSPPVLQSVLCCERESWPHALRLTERMAGWNIILGESLGVIPLATTASSTSVQLDTLSPSPSAALDGGGPTPSGETSPAHAASLRILGTDTVHMLFYVLAQHGRLAEVLRLCEVACGVHASHLLRGCSATGERNADADDALVLMAHLAAANADPAASAAVESGGSKASLNGVVSDRMHCVERVVRAGVVPQRVLSVTEYAVLLRRLMGDRIRGDARRHAAAASAATTTPSAGPCNGVGWWLSPSQVWCLSAGLAHRIRTALCLIGFQVNVRHGQTDLLSLEDLYVVLTISRQLVRRHEVELRQLRDKQVNPMDVSDDGGGDAGSGSSVHQRRQWTGWGVVSESPQSSPLLASSRVTRSLSPPPLQCAQEMLLHLLPARRHAASPGSTHYIQQICATSQAALRRALLLSSSACTASGFAAQQATATAQLSPRVATASRSTTSRTVAGSAVLLSLVSQEMLSVLRAVRYTRNIALFWDSALSTLATQQLHGHDLGAYAADPVRGGGGLSEHDACASSATRKTGDRSQQEEADRVREEVAYALALQAEASVGESLVATRRLVAPLPMLAPYLSAYTVAALVQRPFRRAFTWKQCLALLPYTPLGSRSQLWLVQRIAQDSAGRRHAFPGALTVQAADLPPVPAPHTPSTLSAVSITALQTAVRMVTVRDVPRRRQHHQRSPATTSPSATHDEAKAALSRSFAAPLFGKKAAASVSADATAHADSVLLALLLEGNWSRALQAFAEAPSRVQVGGAPHVVRLLVEADVWRDLGDAQRRPLVRLAVQCSAYSRGGAARLLEEMLQTTLEQGLWHTGLYFHRSVTAERPELVWQCRRAQGYAAQLCCGLLEQTSMAKTVAQLTKAARRSQWAEAAACFLRYATQRRDETAVANTSSTPASSSGGSPADAESDNAATLAAAAAPEAGESTTPPRSARTAAVPPTTTEELESLAALLESAKSGDSPRSTAVCAAASSSPLHLLFHGDSASVLPELAHVVQTARYAMLHTPALWMQALRWIPTTALPLPFHHEQAWRSLCADNTAKLQALLPPPPPRQTGARADEGDISAQQAVVTQTENGTVALAASTTEAALSLVEAARRVHRPQHFNEVAKGQQVAVANALRVLRRAGAWMQATLLYDKAVESHCMPYASSSTVLETALKGGAPWQVTLSYFFRMAQRQRPDVNATAAALQACAAGGQWETAFRVLRQSVLTQAAPVPRLVMLTVKIALQCGVWSRALAAAHQYRRTNNSQLAYTVLFTYVCTQHWDDAVEYFYDCTRRGLRPLDASLELAIIASEAASDECRKTALMVGAIASALEDLYRMSGVVLKHIIFVQRHAQGSAAEWQTASDSLCGAPRSAFDGGADMDDSGDFVLPQPAFYLPREEDHDADNGHDGDNG
ncbi:conserved hypothetical protein [Leishmania mexicana MHOM/GT/2001/U1103]|uniref:Uncharacterized protein n=1 Tax=Leishmania mexicana (strain MHOM/GT/2001/U1103) TaxID=929439 RepID=E9AXK2_LEIMU|nr:conserved hypothetical protein [Leishmania mexicana MHOM/GT/2001/U1103]CBZ27693.1 conserved hypothetical protein [Leishmania mexicana MHOM/GT/2001/U1103]